MHLLLPLLCLTALLGAADLAIPALPTDAKPLPASGFASCTRLESLIKLITTNKGPDGKPAATVEECAIPGGADKALRVTVTSKPTNPWEVQARQEGVVALTAGSIVHLRLRLRAPGGGGVVFAAIQESTAPHSKLIERVIRLNNGWTTIDLPAEVKRDIPAKGWGWTLHFGNKPQTIEIAGVECLSWQKDVALADLPITPEAK
jgi:hypothetical protein